MSWPLCNLCPGHSCYLCLGTAHRRRPPGNDQGLRKEQRLWLEAQRSHRSSNVSVPARLVTESADAALRRVLTWLAAGYGAIFIVVNLGVYVLARPQRRAPLTPPRRAISTPHLNAPRSRADP